jgi:hypothetical protein
MTELWNWKIDGPMGVGEVLQALADVVGRPVLPLDNAGAATRDDGPVLLCDVWRRPGAYPVSVDCYGPPAHLAEVVVVAALARRLHRRCLLPDDTLDASRHLLVDPDGTIRPVHLEVRDTDDGEVLSGQRLCTDASPGCRDDRGLCQRSRWAPDSVLPALAAA